MEPESHSDMERTELGPAEDTPTGWFQLGCALAKQGNQVEAERALKIAVDLQEKYPIAWTVLSAVLLSQARETDAEKAGKMALEQAEDLKITWPKLRSIILNHAILKGKDWKSPRRILCNSSDSTEWASILSQLSETNDELSSEIDIKPEEVDDSLTAVKPIEEIDSEEMRAWGSDALKQTEDENAQIWFGTARIHMVAGRFDQAEKAFMRGLKIDPDNGEALLGVGTLLMKRGLYNKAEGLLVRAVDLLQQSADARFQLALCLQAQERWDESKDLLKIASQKNPKDEEIWVKLGEADFFCSRYEDASRSFLRALRIIPSHQEALFYLGRCMEYRGNNSHAFRVYRKLLYLEPEDSEMLEEMSKSFHRLGEQNSANRAKALAAKRRRST
ncbi:MAG: tetratricopeptide repeat protein [Candidatus Thorarchaeota archaeon]